MIQNLTNLKWKREEKECDKNERPGSNHEIQSWPQESPGGAQKRLLILNFNGMRFGIMI